MNDFQRKKNTHAFQSNWEELEAVETIKVAIVHFAWKKRTAEMRWMCANVTDESEIMQRKKKRNYITVAQKRQYYGEQEQTHYS